ncbi:MAG: sulfatase-like hydrolase/transferase [Campylobacterota bacterium]|nr:sulfatase-like hydrolase/transferase [Campylobacterota bacterium]
MNIKQSNDRKFLTKVKVAILLILPLLYLIYSVYNLYSKSSLISPCDLMVDLQYVVLFLFLEISLFYLFYNRQNLLRGFYNYKDIIITFLVVFIIKIMKFSLTNIDIDFIYLLQIFISSLSEFVIVLPIIFIYKYSFARFFYKISLLFILAMNISSFFYFYNTSELLNPIIFDNVNIVAMQAIFDGLNISDYIFLILGFASFIYIFKIKNNKNTIPMRKSLVIVLIIIVSYNVLFYVQQAVLSKTCSLYGYEKENKNIIVNIANKNTLLDLIQSYLIYTKKDTKKKLTKNIYKEYTEKEKIFLLDRGLINKEKSSYEFNILKYNKVVFIAFESLSNDFINFYNKKIPKESTEFINHLLETYPHLNNFYTTNMPTQEGLNAFIRSKVSFNNFYKNENTLFSFFNENEYYTTYLRGMSKYYGEDQSNAKKYFRATNIIAREELESKYGSNISSNWGVHNDMVYTEAVDIMKNHDKLFLFLKTIDFHHPGVYYGDIDYPKSISKNSVYKSLYWLDKSLEDFFIKLKENNLFDDKTIIFITADHNPHSSFGLDEYLMDYNSNGLRKIPFIVVTKNRIEELDTIKDKYSSQIDILPTFFTSNSDLMGRNIKLNKHNFYITFYNNKFSYINKEKGLNFSLDVEECANYLKIEETAICKLLHNTNNI